MSSDPAKGHREPQGRPFPCIPQEPVWPPSLETLPSPNLPGFPLPTICQEGNGPRGQRDEAGEGLAWAPAGLGAGPGISPLGGTRQQLIFGVGIATIVKKKKKKKFES